MFTFGLDLGNGAVKLVGPGPENRVLIPHALAHCPEGFRRDLSLVPATEDPLGHLHLRITTHSLSKPVEILAGEVVIREYPDRASESTAGEDKAESARHILLGLTALAAAVLRADPRASIVRLGLSTALPLAEYQDPSAREELIRRLKGRHVVRFVTNPNPQWNERTVELYVEAVDVLPEGAPAFLTLAGTDPTLADQTVVVLDVGVRSVDWAVFRRGKYQPGLSGGSKDGGLAVAADRILAAARQEHGPWLGRHRGDVLAALERAARTGGPVMMGGMGRKVDLTALAGEEMERLARDVARLATDALALVGDVDAIILVGGAGTMLAPYLSRVTDLPIRLAEDALWANAIGLFHRAEALAESGRW